MEVTLAMIQEKKYWKIISDALIEKYPGGFSRSDLWEKLQVQMSYKSFNKYLKKWRDTDRVISRTKIRGIDYYALDKESIKVSEAEFMGNQADKKILIKTLDTILKDGKAELDKLESLGDFGIRLTATTCDAAKIAQDGIKN
jgi:hypothetical protein